jgi:hypothetical protein
MLSPHLYVKPVKFINFKSEWSMECGRSRMTLGRDLMLQGSELVVAAQETWRVPISEVFIKCLTIGWNTNLLRK